MVFDVAELGISHMTMQTNGIGTKKVSSRLCKSFMYGMYKSKPGASCEGEWRCRQNKWLKRALSYCNGGDRDVELRKEESADQTARR
jgi:hypothetical protein